MKILAKLLLSFISVAILCAVVGSVGLSQLAKTKKSIIVLSEETILKLDYVNIIDRCFRNIKTATRSMANPLSVNDAEFYTRQVEIIANERKTYGEARKKFEAFEMVSAEKEKYEIVLTNLEKAAAYNNTLINAVNTARTAPADQQPALYAEVYALTAGTERLAMDNLLSSFEDLLKFDQQYYGVELPKKTLASAQVGRIIVLIVTVIAFIVALGCGIMQGLFISGRIK